MSIERLKALLETSTTAKISDHFLLDKDESIIQSSLEYLSSQEATESLLANCYWPKWNSPWWHMSMLFEMGQINRIPKASIQKMVDAVKKQVPVFFRSDLPQDKDPFLDIPCHCSLGNIYQILSAAGVDVDREIPWARSWFLKYQMQDGGLNCDEDAYKVNTPASSIVGTISALEAVLHFTKRDFTTDELKFLDRGAQCLIERELRFGSSSVHNRDEKEDEPDWLNLCFPHFYFFDVLRGLHLILHWSAKRSQLLPAKAIYEVVSSISKKFPDGVVYKERYSYAEVRTLAKKSDGKWQIEPAASLFPSLVQVSKIGSPCPYLTEKWNESKTLMKTLLNASLIK